MHFILFQAHSGWRHLVLLLLFIACIKMLVGWQQKKPWQKIDLQLVSFTNMAVVLQVLMGVILYIIGKSWLTAPAWFSVAHILPALVGTFMTAKASGWAKRGQTDVEKFQWAFIGLLSGGILILVGVVFILMAR